MIPAEQRMHEEVLEQALHWHTAAAREDCDWQAFTLWLEASPLHRRAYDDVALLEDRIGHHAAALREICGRPPHRARIAWAAAALAGFVLAGALAWGLLPALLGDHPRRITAHAGGPTSLSLAGGVRVVLAPGSTLGVAGRHDERLRLDGDAWFEVPHDPRRALTITAGPFELNDIGTRFEVVSSGPLLEVRVADGEVGVLLPGRGTPVPVGAGARLQVAGDPPIAEYGHVAVADVASWREGRLVFRNEPLSLVAAQVGRHAGVTVTVDPSVAQRRFSGVLAIGDGTQLVTQLVRIMDLRERRDGSVVHLSAPGEPAGR